MTAAAAGLVAAQPISRVAAAGAVALRWTRMADPPSRPLGVFDM
jgi:hypothetical protein